MILWVIYCEIIQMIYLILDLAPEERWRRVGSGLHALHKHLQTHVQQQLKESLGSIHRFKKASNTYDNTNKAGPCCSPPYQKDLIPWQDVSATSMETPRGTIPLDPSYVTKLSHTIEQLCRRGGSSLGSQTS